MKKITLLTLTLLSILTFATLSSAAPQYGRNDRDRVCFYQDIHYQGWEDCFGLGDEVANLRSHNDAISSIRIYGRARVVVFDDSEFRGQAIEFSQDVPDLGRRSLNGSRTWSDRIESFRVGSGYNAPLPGNNAPFGRNNAGQYPGQNPGQNRRNMRDGICVYEHANFQGRSDCFQAGEELRDLARLGWSDRISSIEVFGNAVVAFYRDVGFRGERVIIDRDLHDLAIVQLRGGMSWNDQISSLEVDLDRGNNGRGRGLGLGRGRPR
jgi:hypothetical protein